MTIALWQGIVGAILLVVGFSAIDVWREGRLRSRFVREILLEALRRDGTRGLVEVPPPAAAKEIPGPDKNKGEDTCIPN